MAKEKKPVHKVVMTEGKKDISETDQKIISMYARGMTPDRFPIRLWISMVLRLRKVLAQT